MQSSRALLLSQVASPTRSAHVGPPGMAKRPSLSDLMREIWRDYFQDTAADPESWLEVALAAIRSSRSSTAATCCSRIGAQMEQVFERMVDRTRAKFDVPRLHHLRRQTTASSDSPTR
jgi:hypothetical protein